MNEEEKCGQMTQINLDAVLKQFIELDDNPIDMDKLRWHLKQFKIGSIFDKPGGVAGSSKVWQEIITTIQDMALNETRLKIPVLYGIDSVHGANFIQEAVLFPQALNLAATFNTDLVEQIAEITARETRAVGIPWNFYPTVDVGRQHAWSRYCVL